MASAVILECRMKERQFLFQILFCPLSLTRVRCTGAMKFEVYLANSAVAEWRSRYINYSVSDNGQRSMPASQILHHVMCLSFLFMSAFTYNDVCCRCRCRCCNSVVVTVAVVLLLLLLLFCCCCCYCCLLYRSFGISLTTCASRARRCLSRPIQNMSKR